MNKTKKRPSRNLLINKIKVLTEALEALQELNFKSKTNHRITKVWGIEVDLFGENNFQLYRIFNITSKKDVIKEAFYKYGNLAGVRVVEYKPTENIKVLVKNRGDYNNE